MANLKAGNLPNLSLDTLAGRMDAEFRTLWSQYKPEIELPDDAGPRLDRQLMFLSIARGMLRYLHDHRDDIETTEVAAGGAGTDHDHDLDFGWD